MKEVEKEMILKAIQDADGNKTLAAKMLNMNVRTFYRKVKMFNIE